MFNRYGDKKDNTRVSNTEDSSTFNPKIVNLDITLKDKYAICTLYIGGFGSHRGFIPIKAVKFIKIRLRILNY